MMMHTHKWGPDGDCDGVLILGGRLTPCHAQRCAAPDCPNKRTPPLDYCEPHRALARRLTTAHSEGRA
jgi:hypothetical protein